MNNRHRIGAVACTLNLHAVYAPGCLSCMSSLCPIFTAPCGFAKTFSLLPAMTTRKGAANDLSILSSCHVHICSSKATIVSSLFPGFYMREQLFSTFWGTLILEETVRGGHFDLQCSNIQSRSTALVWEAGVSQGSTSTQCRKSVPKVRSGPEEHVTRKPTVPKGGPRQQGYLMTHLDGNVGDLGGSVVNHDDCLICARLSSPAQQLPYSCSNAAHARRTCAVQ